MRVGQSGPVQVFLDEQPENERADPREVLVIIAPNKELQNVIEALGNVTGPGSRGVWDTFHAMSEVLVDEEVASPLSNAELDKKIAAMEKANPGLMDAVAGEFFR